MKKNLASILEDLKRDGRRKAPQVERLYRALGDTAIGIRAGYLPHQDILELLIEVPLGWSGETVMPEWRGMRNEVVPLRIPPREDAFHLRLYLISPEHLDVFLAVCEDLVAAIENIPEAVPRVGEIEACLLRWRRFFEHYGPGGLSIDMQQGLFAELTFLNRVLMAGIVSSTAISAWKGCEGGYYDFDFEGHVLEVKSTRTKEPRNVTISNEKQLDDQGVKSLHLYVLGIQILEGGGVTLPEHVDSLRSSLANTPAALEAFERKLSRAGYFDRDAKNYKKCFVVKAEDFYRVFDGFPRLTMLPTGIGNLRYSLFLSACESFREDIERYILALKESRSGKRRA